MKTVNKINTVLLLFASCLFSCNRNYPSFEKEFVYMENAETIEQSFLGLHDSVVIEVGGGDQEEWRRITGYYSVLDMFIVEELKSKRKEVSFKERPYYTAIYTGGTLTENKVTNYLFYPFGIKELAQEIYDRHLPLNSFFKSVNFTQKNDISTKIGDLGLSKIIKIVDIFDGNTKICSSFLPCLFATQEDKVICLNKYNSYSPDCGYDLCFDTNHSYITILDLDRISHKYINEFNHHIYGRYSLFSSRLEIDNDGFCYIQRGGNALYLIEAGLTYEMLEKDICYTIYHYKEGIKSIERNVVYYKFNLMEVIEHCSTISI